MANDIFRSQASAAVANAISKAKADSDLEHNGLKGAMRETHLADLIRYFLPRTLAVGNGVIMDCNNVQSSQTDLIIYTEQLLPPAMGMHHNETNIYPIESSLYSIEVKSVLTSTHLDDAIGKSHKLKQLTFTPGFYSYDGTPMLVLSLPVVFCLFAFGTDLAKGGKTEFDRYKELDPKWESDPCIPAFCVCGVGYWTFGPQGQGWQFFKPTEDHNEVKSFIGGILHTLPAIFASRGNPRIGHYLIPQGSHEPA